MGASDVSEANVINQSDSSNSDMNIEGFSACHPNKTFSKSDTNTSLLRNAPLLVSSGVSETHVQVVIPTPVTKSQVSAPTSNVG